MVNEGLQTFYLSPSLVTVPVAVIVLLAVAVRQHQLKLI